MGFTSCLRHLCCCCCHGKHGEEEDGAFSSDAGSDPVDAAPKLVDVNLLDVEENKKRGYHTNEIRTAKYTLLTAIPVGLFYQFHKVSNIYFLFVMTISLIPGASPINPMSSILPFSIVLGVGILRDIWVDVKRQNADKAANRAPVKVLRDNNFVEIPSAKVYPGDVMLVQVGEEIKADCVVLNTSITEGLLYIDTANLDGETNAKIRRAKPETVDKLGTVEDIEERAIELSNSRAPVNMPVRDPNNHKTEHHRGVLFTGSAPNPDLASWFGKLQFATGDVVPLGIDQFLPRGCVLRNTEWILVLVMYAGKDTKILLNYNARSDKYSIITRRLNWLNAILFAINQVMMLTLCGCSVWFKKSSLNHKAKNTDHAMWYMQWQLNQYSDVALFWWRYLTNFVLVSYLIPLSLYVTLEFNKAMQFLMMGADRRMAVHDVFTDTTRYARPKTAELNPELGHVRYIFTDKTGTLTENLMTYVGGYVADEPHDECSNPGGVGGKLRDQLVACLPPSAGKGGGGSGTFHAMGHTRQPSSSVFSHSRHRSSGGEGSFVAPTSVLKSISEDVLEKNMRFQYLRALSLCHSVLCFNVKDIEGSTKASESISAMEKAKKTSCCCGGSESDVAEKDAMTPRSNSTQKLEKPTLRLVDTSITPKPIIKETHIGSPAGPEDGSLAERTPAKDTGAMVRFNTAIQEDFVESEVNSLYSVSGPQTLSSQQSRKASQHGVPLSPGFDPSEDSHHDVRHRRTRPSHDISMRFHLPNSIKFEEFSSEFFCERKGTTSAQHSRQVSLGVDDHGMPPSLGNSQLLTFATHHSQSPSRRLHGKTNSASWFYHQFTSSVALHRSEYSARVLSLVDCIDRSKFYEGQSLDEVALVSAARENGFSLLDRSTRSIRVKMLDTVRCYQVIAENEFTPQRKLMSILLKRDPSMDDMDYSENSTSAHTYRRTGKNYHSPPLSGPTMPPIESPFTESSRSQPLETTRGPSGRLTDEDNSPGDGSRITGAATTVAGSPGSSVSHVHEPRDYLLLVKGADSSMLSIVNHKHAENRRMQQELTNHLNESAKLGLRTLVFGQRYLSKLEVSQWMPKLESALCCMHDRSVKLHEAYAEIEKDIDLIGATAVEDKLQDGVPDTLRFFLSASIVVWMLTGDKRETAVTIAISSGLVEADDMGQTDSLAHLCVAPPTTEDNGMGDETEPEFSPTAQLEDQFAAAEALIEQKRDRIESSVVIVVDGKTLDYIFADEACSQRFFSIGCKCRSAVCCRLTPLQKAQIVSMFKKHTDSVTLAIGDGANDVSMIQESHIGVGIMGLEGSQAELASDYAIPKFRFLRRLLMVHGRYSLYRDSHCVLYSIYKNAFLTVGMVGFTCYSGFSGQTFVDSWYLAMFSVFFCSLQPFIIGILDKDVDDKLAEAVPTLYPALSREYMYFSVPYAAKWITDGAVEGLFCFMMLVYGVGYKGNLFASRDGSLLEYGFVFFIIMVLVTDIRAATQLVYYTLATGFVLVLTFLLIVLVPFVYSSFTNFGGSNSMVYVASDVFGSSIFYVLMILVVGFSFLYTLSVGAYIQLFAPWKNAPFAVFASKESNEVYEFDETKMKLIEEYSQRVEYQKEVDKLARLMNE